MLVIMSFTLLLVQVKPEDFSDLPPLITLQENGSITSFVRNVALAKSHTNLPVPVLSLGERIYNGLFVLQDNFTLFDLSKMAFELKPGIEKAGNSIGTYKHRHNFEVITCPFIDSLFIPFITLLSQPKCHLICKTKDPNTLKQVSYYNESSNVLFVYELEQEKRCVSQVIFDTIYKECKLETFPHITYYVTSLQREDEVRIAYKDDRIFNVKTVTGLIHACVLKTMFPHMKIVVNEQDIYNDSLYPIVKNFCQTHFLM